MSSGGWRRFLEGQPGERVEEVEMVCLVGGCRRWRMSLVGGWRRSVSGGKGGEDVEKVSGVGRVERM